MSEVDMRTAVAVSVLPPHGADEPVSPETLASDLRRHVDVAVKSVRESVEARMEQAREIQQRVNNLVVVDENTARTAADVALAAKRMADELEQERKRITQPMTDGGKTIKAIFDGMINPISAASDTAKRKAFAFKMAEEKRLAEEARRRREEEEAKALEIAETLRDAGRADLADAQLDMAAETIQDRAPEKVAIAGNMAKMSERTTWEFEVVNKSAVPMAYLLVDEKAIRIAIRDGVREIPGVRIFQETRSVLR